MTLVLVDRKAIRRALALVLLVRCAQGPQLGVPVGLERVGDESIGGVHLHIAMPRLVGLVLRTLDLAVSQAIGLIEAGSDLLLHGERQLQGHRRHRFDEQLANGDIDLGAHDALTRGLAEAPAAAKAHVVGNELAAPAVTIVNVHTVAAQSAHGTALQ